MTTFDTAAARVVRPVRHYPVRDSLTMLRRNLRRMRRYPSMTIMLVGMPVIFLLLFVYVFGGTLGRGLPGAGIDGGRHAYLSYVTPAILVFTVASIGLGTAVSVALDVTSGIMARFRTMAISPSSVLTGHVVGTMIQIVLALAALLGIAALLGYRSNASAADWLGAAGILVLFGLALTWLTVALGLASKSVESASNTPMILVLLPFLGSGFVPPSSMPGWLAAFARNQPFTPTTDAVRGLLAGAPHSHDVALAIVWCVAITAVGFAWARHLFQRRGRAVGNPAQSFAGRPTQ